jgi:hypothetical protein
VCQQRRRRGFLKKLGKIPGVRASENASTTNAVRAIAGPCAVPAFPAGRCGCGCGYGRVRCMCAAGQLSALGVAATASSACSFELRAGLGDLRHAASTPPFPGPWADQQPSWIGIDRSVPASPDRTLFFEAPPDVSGLTSHTYWQSPTHRWRLFVVAGLERPKGRMAWASETASVKLTEKRRPSQQGGAR